MAVRNDPRQWLDLINFRSDYFPVGWRDLYKLCKQRWPGVSFALNHDSHNTFGGAAGQEGGIFVDDVYHWGSDWADLLTFDIYPYLMKDFRYGPNRTLMVPRMSQMHYAMAHMRNLVESGGKTLGFYVGTYNPEWFDLTPEGRKIFWQSREMAYTAVAGGADFLIGGIDVPIDAHHWDDLGEGIAHATESVAGDLEDQACRREGGDAVSADAVHPDAGGVFQRRAIVRDVPAGVWGA